MTTLLESKARPYGSKKGAVLSVVVHGVIIAAALLATGKAVLPAREKTEEHSILYVAPPPPKVAEAPKPLPEVKKPPVSKAVHVAPPLRAPEPVRRFVDPTPRPTAPQRVAAPVIAPIKVPTSLPNVDKAIAINVDLPASDPSKTADIITGRGSKRGTSDGDVEGEGRGKGGLTSGSSNRAYTENQVDRTVQVTRPATPRYPEALKSVNVEGQVVVRYIVDARGRVEPGSIQILSTTHKLFADAVREALLEARYRPAEAGGHPVRQLVEQPFMFKLNR
jgi:TonB family protein